MPQVGAHRLDIPNICPTIPSGFNRFSNVISCKTYQPINIPIEIYISPLFWPWICIVCQEAQDVPKPQDGMGLLRPSFSKSIQKGTLRKWTTWNSIVWTFSGVEHSGSVDWHKWFAPIWSKTPGRRVSKIVSPRSHICLLSGNGYAILETPGRFLRFKG